MKIVCRSWPVYASRWGLWRSSVRARPSLGRVSEKTFCNFLTEGRARRTNSGHDDTANAVCCQFDRPQATCKMLIDHARLGDIAGVQQSLTRCSEFTRMQFSRTLCPPSPRDNDENRPSQRPGRGRSCATAQYARDWSSARHSKQDIVLARR